MATNETINACIALLHAQPYGGRPKGDADLLKLRDLWRGVFHDVDDDLLKAATMSYIASGGQFWPLASQIRRECASLIAQVDGTSTAQDAWSSLVSRFRTGVGAPLPGELGAAAEAALRAVGGWQTLCDATQHEMISHRARFIEAHEAHRDKATATLLQPPAVAGFVEARRQQALELMQATAAQLGAGGNTP